MAKQCDEELPGEGRADGACRFARLLIGVVEDGQEIEGAPAECELMNLAECEVAHKSPRL